MADNFSFVFSEAFQQDLRARMIFSQVLVVVFISINLLLITTFFSKDVFYTTMRYILFAQTLISDCVILITGNILLILNNVGVHIQLWLCLLVCVLGSLCNFVTPLTLTAMTQERYVAVCMPLRHAELCSPRRALQSIFLIQGLSIIPCTVILSVFFATVTVNYFNQNIKCRAEFFILSKWQSHLRSAIGQLYFLIMFITIILSYVQIMKVAKVASGENKKSSQKGLKTVVFHGFQLLLSLIQLWCPLVEAAVLHLNFMLYVNLRYMNYILFILVPRCLIPLIYGLRDEKFCLALKHYVLCGLFRKKSCNFDWKN